jgi:hypothetical protein
MCVQGVQLADQKKVTNAQANTAEAAHLLNAANVGNFDLAQKRMGSAMACLTHGCATNLA